MTRQFESLIDLEQLDKNLIKKAFKSQKPVDIYLAFDDSIDTIMIMFKDPQDVDTATYNLSDRLACVVDIDSMQIVGFWLMQFTRFWIEMKEFKEIKAIWEDIIAHDILTSYRKIQKKSGDTSKRKRGSEKGNNGKTEQVIKELFESNELMKELCLA